MSKRRGNSIWAKPQLGSVAPTSSTFENTVKALGLTPEGYIDSVALKRWVIENKDYKYVPTELLNAWGLARDISIRGLFLFTDMRFDKGGEMDIILTVPIDSNTAMCRDFALLGSDTVAELARRATPRAPMLACGNSCGGDYALLKPFRRVLHSFEVAQGVSGHWGSVASSRWNCADSLLECQICEVTAPFPVQLS